MARNIWTWLFRTRGYEPLPEMLGSDDFSECDSSSDSEADDHGVRKSFNLFGYSSIQNNNTGPGQQNIYNQSVNSSPSRTWDDRANDLLKALKVVHYQDGKDRYRERAANTCEWIARDPRLLDWEQSNHARSLWITADPGCGKSVLAKYMVDEKLAGGQGSNKDRIICYFFSMNIPSSIQDREACALSCMLHQIFSQNRKLIQREVIERLEKEGNVFLGSVNELWNILVGIARKKELICVLDGFDEFPNMANSLRIKFGTLKDLPEGVQLKFLVTSRPYKEIKECIWRSAALHVMLSGDDGVTAMMEQDIEFFIDARIKEIATDRELTEVGSQILHEGLRKHTNRTYLWVHLVLGLVESSSLEEESLRQMMSELPENVEKAYHEILERTADREATLDVLMILVAAERTLTLSEMRILRQLGDGKYTTEVPTSSLESFRQQLKWHAALLVTIRNDKIYLLHQTAKDFLVENSSRMKGYTRSRSNQPIVWKQCIPMSRAHGSLAELCMSYPPVIYVFAEAQGANAPPDAFKSYALFDYAATFWASHYRKSHKEDQDTLRGKAEALLFCAQTDCVTWFHTCWRAWESKDPASSKIPQGFTPLMLMCYLGLDCLVQQYLKIPEGSLDQRDRPYRRTALTWASKKGHNDVVRMLLERRGSRWWSRGLKVNSADFQGWTALFYAVYNCHLQVVKLLLKNGARQNIKDKVGRNMVRDVAVAVGGSALPLLDADIEKQRRRRARFYIERNIRRWRSRCGRLVGSPGLSLLHISQNVLRLILAVLFVPFYLCWSMLRPVFRARRQRVSKSIRQLAQLATFSSHIAHHGIMKLLLTAVSTLKQTMIMDMSIGVFFPRPNIRHD